jgi:pyridinium-3,5-bisthiocarboxylic acid mononucleotide nickel chelatase
MRVAHFDCFSGISGDMTLGALLDLGLDAALFHDAIASLQLPVRLEIEKIKRNGFVCTNVHVRAEDQENQRYLPEVEAIIDLAAITESAKTLAKKIFRRLAEAEGKVHGHPIDKVHFHEVGALDSIADIIGSAVGLDALKVDRFTSRSVPPGSGTIKCDHGIMPIPTPATAELLKGVPLATAAIKGELVTPTGAAILTTLVTEYTDQPGMIIEQTGCGSGKRDYWEQPNILRMFVGQSVATITRSVSEQDTIAVLETNVDDCSPEFAGYAIERLFAAGVLDAFAIPIQMKKSRPGYLITALCEPEKIQDAEALLFRELGTFGIRRSILQRSKLQREAITVTTPWGPIQAKRGWQDGLSIISPEFEACAKVARENDVPLREVYQAVLKS